MQASRILCRVPVSCLFKGTAKTPLTCIRVQTKNCSIKAPEIKFKKLDFSAMSQDETQLAIFAGLSAVGLIGTYVASLGKPNNDTGIPDQAGTFSTNVRNRTQKTFRYILKGVVVTSVAVFALTRQPTLLIRYRMDPAMGALIAGGALLGSEALCRVIRIPYIQSLEYYAHCGVLGAVLATFALSGGLVYWRALLNVFGCATGYAICGHNSNSSNSAFVNCVLGSFFGVGLSSTLGKLMMPIPRVPYNTCFVLHAIKAIPLVWGFYAAFNVKKVTTKWQEDPRRSNPIIGALNCKFNTYNMFTKEEESFVE